MNAKSLLLAISVGMLTSQAALAQVMCPDGSFVSKGPCVICPDGTFIGGGGRCQMAPNGQFVPETRQGPRMTPNGTFVQGGGGMVMCPDGSFVAGSRCVMTPNGRFVGQ